MDMSKLYVHKVVRIQIQTHVYTTERQEIHNEFDCGVDGDEIVGTTRSHIIQWKFWAIFHGAQVMVKYAVDGQGNER